jgi:hypothetical protein
MHGHRLKGCDCYKQEPNGAVIELHGEALFSSCLVTQVFSAKTSNFVCGPSSVAVLAEASVWAPEIAHRLDQGDDLNILTRSRIVELKELAGHIQRRYRAYKTAKMYPGGPIQKLIGW